MTPCCRPSRVLPVSWPCPGETTCREVAPCGDGPWGEIPVEPNTQFVDGSYVGGDSDGSPQRPWPTIQAGVNAASPGAIVAIAAGTYVEDVEVVNQAVRLWGRCPAMVEIVGSASAFATMDIWSIADGSEVHDLAITGPPPGLGVAGVTAIVADRVWIHDTGRRGVRLTCEPGRLARSNHFPKLRRPEGWGANCA